MRDSPSILSNTANVMEVKNMTNLGKCSQAEYAQPMGFVQVMVRTG